MLKIAYHYTYNYPLPKKHRFPMEKYSLLKQQLLYEGTCSDENFFNPGLPSNEVVLAVHTKAYFDSLLNLTIDKRAARKIGFPLSAKFVERGLRIAQGTIEACKFALENGIAMNIAGGTHHAYSDSGEGFCMLNDQAIAATYLLQNHAEIHKILIVDLDVHQGNGTAKIFQNNDSVFTFSMHGAGNYPFKKEKSDLDLAIPDGSGDAVYLSILKRTLPQLMDEQQPDFIFYLSGVDILETDKLGRLNCSVEACKERDRFVLQMCKDLEIPVAVSMGGGYSPEIKTIIGAHANTFRLAKEIYF
ncbi:histone deacetylase family protein [Aequorivita marina]|uniref:histone deacetylase family protein n=1 Tax=Aequorivita marina TaxID=3073654 RepID=UPI002876A8AA|nr:histone deacetylase [Aequorivita sp. S2608]MDS1299039.1 histone deacetylase [Aequorivita sp. S2608]